MQMVNFICLSLSIVFALEQDKYLVLINVKFIIYALAFEINIYINVCASIYIYILAIYLSIYILEA